MLPAAPSRAPHHTVPGAPRRVPRQVARLHRDVEAWSQRAQPSLKVLLRAAFTELQTATGRATFAWSTWNVKEAGALEDVYMAVPVVTICSYLPASSMVIMHEEAQTRLTAEVRATYPIPVFPTLAILLDAALRESFIAFPRLGVVDGTSADEWSTMSSKRLLLRVNVTSVTRALSEDALQQGLMVQPTLPPPAPAAAGVPGEPREADDDAAVAAAPASVLVPLMWAHEITVPFVMAPHIVCRPPTSVEILGTMMRFLPDPSVQANRTSPLGGE